MKIAIVGSGVTGIISALRIKDKYPEAKMTVFDAGPDPRISSRTDSHHPSWGDDKTKIVRQLTGSESLSLPGSEAILID
jgi:predicted NAD/FAD-binding protein